MGVGVAEWVGKRQCRLMGVRAKAGVGTQVVNSLPGTGVSTDPHGIGSTQSGILAPVSKENFESLPIAMNRQRIGRAWFSCPIVLCTHMA